MNTEIQHLLSTIEGLLSSQLKMAEAHGLDSLPNITAARARTILAEIRAVSKPKKAKDPAYFAHLDRKLQSM